MSEIKQCKGPMTFKRGERVLVNGVIIEFMGRCRVWFHDVDGNAVRLKRLDKAEAQAVE